MTPTLRFENKIAVLDLGDDENRFSPDWLDSVDKLLDQALGEGAHALVTTATGKFYSNGLDLDWLGAHTDKANWYVQQVQSLFARMLTFPMPTVAAVNGHAFGAGAMLGVAHDYRVMRDDRGYYCFPEVDINIPFTEGMAALIQAKLTPASAVVAMTTGRRYGGSDALAAGLVDATASVEALTTKAIDIVAPIGPKNPGTLGSIKSTMFASVVTALRTERP
ncbi:enoyl-CoA hydratase-related protein [Rhodococcus globerulus]|uniref:enoyl-CoA hydratase-related protein n=1 Tax=Rhodococcus globerulus TaxID=33008 RepID=UPI000AAFC96F|nr:enoyl-CoA hydratase-related protein [Rhodococcus globerulus]